MKLILLRGPGLGFLLIALGAASFLGLIPASAATMVVPPGDPSAEGAAADGALLSSGDVTGVIVISAGVLADVGIGGTIDALSWRLDGSYSASEPGKGANFKNFQMYAGQAAVTPTTMDSVVANNYVAGTRTQVANKLQVSKESLDPGSPAPFDLTIPFDTPYVYAGGDLVIEYTHRGSGGTSLLLDGLAAGSLTTINQFVDLGYQSSSVSQASSVAIPMVTYTPLPTPEPSTLGLLVLSAALCLRRRRANRWTHD